MISSPFFKITKIAKLNQDNFSSRRANPTDSTTLRPTSAHFCHFNNTWSVRAYGAQFLDRFGCSRSTMRSLLQHQLVIMKCSMSQKEKKKLNSHVLEGLRSRSVGEGLATIAPCNGWRGLERVYMTLGSIGTDRLLRVPARKAERGPQKNLKESPRTTGDQVCRLRMWSCGMAKFSHSRASATVDRGRAL